MPAVTHDTTEARFNALYTQYRQSVKRRIQFILRDSQELVEEVEQETWLKVWRALTPEREVKYLYLSTIASRAGYDALRQKYHIHAKHEYVPPTSLDERDQDGFLVHEQMEALLPDLAEQAAQREEVRALLSLVNSKSRRIFLLFTAGYSYKELQKYAGYSFQEVSYALRLVHARAHKANLDKAF